MVLSFRKIVVKLYANNTLKDTKELNAGNNWYHLWTLDKYDANDNHRNKEPSYSIGKELREDNLKTVKKDYEFNSEFLFCCATCQV